MSSEGTVRVCVLGAGVIGLSVAVNIKEQLPDVEVTIMADKFGRETTSSVAGGLIVPHALGETPLERIIKWTSASRDEAARHLRLADAGSTGVLLVPCYMAYTEKKQPPDLEYSVFGFRELPSTEIETLFGKSYPTVFHFTALVWEPVKYLSWLTSRYEQHGGLITRRKVSSLHEILPDYDIIINCTGVGANQVIGDKDVVPIRGQIVQVKAPWVNYAFILNEGDTYIVPGSDSLKMGGTHQYGNWDLHVSEDDKHAILENCTRVLPRLKEAKYLADLVGLRPGRSQVRLERENVHQNGKITRVIHNYGHGGAGVTLSWGCALETTQLLRECINEFRTTKMSKL